jgi:NAD(P)-dependent dehydrogenase (short-subunit alcohol dehydrogenase family)
MDMHPADLLNRVAVITGAGRGIGRAVALEFAAQGARVAAVARSAADIAGTVRLVKQSGGVATAVQADVTDPEAVQQAVERTKGELGPVSILVNNAGVSGPAGPIWQNDPADWWRTVETHVRGTFLFAHAVLPDMIAGGGGHILTMASGAALGPQQYFSAYGVAKNAQVRLMETLAEEGREHGVIAFAVSPGLVYTDMVAGMIADSEVQKWRPQYVERVIASRDHGDFTDAMEKATRLCVTLASGHADLLSGRHFHPVHDIEAELAKARAELAPRS